MTDVMKVLEQVAAKLGVAVEYLWEILVRQKVAEGATNLITAGILLVAIVVMCCVTPGLNKRCVNKYRELKDDRIENGTGYDGSRWIPSFEEDIIHAITKSMWWVTCVVVFILTLMIISDVKIGIQQLINPEYFAIKEILDAIGGV